MDTVIWYRYAHDMALCCRYFGGTMQNPYAYKPDYQFWRRSVAGKSPTDVDPVVSTRFAIGPEDRIATAGSCFAQHVSRTLDELGFRYMVAEQAPAFPFSGRENFGTFSARYGNIYTVRQLRQLFRRAYSLFVPADIAWQREDGRYVDPFRPYIVEEGFATEEEVVAEREAHLEAVRTVLEDCDVFIFTLGLTEGWEAIGDGAVFPLAPGVVGARGEDTSYRFRNFGLPEMTEDLADFFDCLSSVNPSCRVLLTVSPVPLIATYEDAHVLTATTYSKSALRVVAEEMRRRFAFVDYFPSYEMITGPHVRGAFWADDLREVRPEGVRYAMSKFAANFLGSASLGPGDTAEAPSQDAIDRQRAAMTQIAAVICDEERIG